MLLQNDDERLKCERINSCMVNLAPPFADQITSHIQKPQTQTQQIQKKHQKENQSLVASYYDQPIKKFRFDCNVYYDCAYTDVTTVIDTLQIDKSSKRKGPRGGVAVPFPARLQIMLENMNNHDNNDVSNNNNDDKNNINSIVCWQSHGRSFHIHNVKKFVSFVMPRYFQQTKFTSFQRQLNLYGFQRVTSSNSSIDHGTYYHELFLRGRPDLCSIMIRTNVSCTKQQPLLSLSSTPLPIIGLNMSSNVKIVNTNTKISSFFEMQICPQSSKSVHHVQSLLPTSQILKHYETQIVEVSHDQRRVTTSNGSKRVDTVGKNDTLDKKIHIDVNNFHIPVDDLHNTKIMDSVFMKEAGQYGMIYCPENIIENDYLVAAEFLNSLDSSTFGSDESSDTKSIISLSDKMDDNIVTDISSDNDDDDIILLQYVPSCMDDESLNELDFLIESSENIKYCNLVEDSPHSRKRKCFEEGYTKETESSTLRRRRDTSTVNEFQVMMKQSSIELKPLPMKPKLPNSIVPMKNKHDYFVSSASSTSGSSSSTSTTTNTDIEF